MLGGRFLVRGVGWNTCWHFLLFVHTAVSSMSSLRKEFVPRSPGCVFSHLHVITSIPSCLPDCLWTFMLCMRGWKSLRNQVNLLATEMKNSKHAHTRTLFPLCLKTDEMCCRLHSCSLCVIYVTLWGPCAHLMPEVMQLALMHCTTAQRGRLGGFNTVTKTMRRS